MAGPGSDFGASAVHLLVRSVSRVAAHVVLFTALILVSTSGPFIVSAHMDAYAVVVWRTTFAAVLFLGYAAFEHGSIGIAKEHRGRVAAGGVLLGAHFVLWVKAFDLTDYSSNLLLLVAQPAIAALLSLRLGERQSKDTWISIGLACAGLGIIAGGDFGLGARALLGDAMCIAGGLAIALFYVVTRDARSATPLPRFMGWTMIGCALTALPAAFASRAVMIDYPAASWWWLTALAVLTTVGGHGLMNLAARHVTLFTLNVVIVLEPGIAIAMGAALFGAEVTALQLAGGALLTAAVIVGLRGERRINAALPEAAR